MDIVENLTRMLDRGQDSAVLRFSLGSELLKREDRDAAIEHLRAALAIDPNYSAAYKLLGRALVDAGAAEAARDVYTKGIQVAEDQGDQQAMKEMGVFLKRLNKKT